jgi:hypothetical protein
MTQLEIAQEAARVEFNKWNEITGVFHEYSSYLWEIKSLLEDAAEIGYRIGKGEPLETIIADITKRNDTT